MTKTRPPVSAVYIPEQGEITLTPVIEGSMKVSVSDLCLEVDRVASSTVTVAGEFCIYSYYLCILAKYVLLLKE